MPAFLAALPALAAAGGSIFGGISGKSQAKKQEKLARDQMRQLQPLIDTEIAGSQQALRERQRVGQETFPRLQQGGNELAGLAEFWRPLISGDMSAINQFLAPERGAINEGYRALLRNITRFAPRGGGRVSSLVQAEENKQRDLSNLIFGARRTGAEQLQGIAQLLSQLGLQGAGIATGAPSALGPLLGQLTTSQNRAFGAQQAGSEGLQSSLRGVGGLLFDLFRPGGGASRPIVDSPFRTPNFNPFGGGTSGGFA